MREKYTFYYRLFDGSTGHYQFKAVSVNDALDQWYQRILNEKLDVVDYDYESEAIEEEREC